jgi:hypothetical protein
MSAVSTLYVSRNPAILATARFTQRAERVLHTFSLMHFTSHLEQNKEVSVSTAYTTYPKDT